MGPDNKNEFTGNNQTVFPGNGNNNTEPSMKTSFLGRPRPNFSQTPSSAPTSPAFQNPFSSNGSSVLSMPTQSVQEPISFQSKPGFKKKLSLKVIIIAVAAIVLVVATVIGLTSLISNTKKEEPDYSAVSKAIWTMNDKYGELVDSYKGILMSFSDKTDGALERLFPVTEAKISDTRKLLDEVKENEGLAYLKGLDINKYSFKQAEIDNINNMVANVTKHVEKIEQSVSLLEEFQSAFISPIYEMRTLGSYKKCSKNDSANNLLLSDDQQIKKAAEVYYKSFCNNADFLATNDENSIFSFDADRRREAKKILASSLYDDSNDYFRAEIKDIYRELSK